MNDENSIEIQIPAAEKIAMAIVVLCFAMMGGAFCVAAFVPSWRGQSSPFGLFFCGVLLWGFAGILSNPLRLGFWMRADERGMIYAKDGWPTRVSWNEVEDFYTLPDNDFSPSPHSITKRRFVPPTLRGQNGKVLFNGATHVVRNSADFEAKQQFWQFVIAQLPDKQVEAPKQTTIQRFTRRGGYRNRMGWQSGDWNWKVRRVGKLLKFTFVLSLPIFGIGYFLVFQSLNWPKGSLTGQFVGNVLALAIFYAPVLIVIWRHKRITALIKARSEQRRKTEAI